MFKIDYTSFSLGILFILLIGLVVLLVSNHRRHSCTACSRGTKKTCRIFVHNIDRDTPTGFRKVSVYVFRQCMICATVRVDVIDKLMEDYKLKRKPREEMDFSSDVIRQLFRLVPHVSNPFGSSSVVFKHYTIRSRHVTLQRK